MSSSYFVSFQFGLVHYFTKIGSGEYYLEELEETVCAVDARKRKALEKRVVRQLKCRFAAKAGIAVRGAGNDNSEYESCSDDDDDDAYFDDEDEEEDMPGMFDEQQFEYEKKVIHAAKRKARPSVFCQQAGRALYVLCAISRSVRLEKSPRFFLPATARGALEAFGSEAS